MSGLKSPDIIIGSEPYLFGPKGGVNIGDARMEPGVPRQVGTITIPSAHHGFGQEIANHDPQAAQLVSKFWAEPGFLLAGGSPATSAINMAGWVDVRAFPAVLPDRPAQVFHAYSGDGVKRTFIVLPRSIYEYDGTTTPVLRLSAPSSFPATETIQYTNVARWRGKFIIGMENLIVPAPGSEDDATARYGYKYAEYDIKTNVFANKTAGGDVAVSYVAATANAVFRIVNFGRYRTPELYIGDVPTVNFGSVAWIGPIYVHKGGNATNLYAYGPHLLIFKREGVMLGMDTGEVFNPLLEVRDSTDDLFGGSVEPFGGHLLITTGTDLFLFDPQTLEYRNVSPPDVQAYISADASLTRPAIVRSVKVRGNEVFAVCTSTLTSNASVVARGVMHEDGLHWTQYHSIATDGEPRGCGFYETSGGDARFLAIVRDTTLDVGHAHVHSLKLYGAGLSTFPEAYVGSGSYKSARVAADGVANGLSCRPLQVRFWRGTVGGGGHAVSLIIEDGSPISLGTVAPGTGGVRLDIPDSAGSVRIGRYFQVQIDETGAVPTADAVQRIDFPLCIDYEFAPNVKDALTIVIHASSEQINRMGGEWITRSGRKILDDLSTLHNTRVVVEFPEDGVQWPVWVEEVETKMESPTGVRTGSPEWYVILHCRRLD